MTSVSEARKRNMRKTKIQMNALGKNALISYITCIFKKLVPISK